MSELTFWDINDTGKLVIKIVDLYEFLSVKGFRVKKEENTLSLYCESGNIIEEISPTDLVGQIVNYLKNTYKYLTEREIHYPKKSPEFFSYTPIDVLEAAAKFGFNRIISEPNWKLLPDLEVEPQKHNSTEAFFYFKNGFVSVSKLGAKLHAYTELQGSIYKDLIIDKEIKIINIHKENEIKKATKGHCFWNFLEKITGLDENKRDVEIKAGQRRLQYLLSLVGYLLHDYRKKGATDYAVVLCDDEVGGSGKGLLIQAIEQLTNVCCIDAKQKDTRFSPSSLTISTKLKCYNDIERSFDFKKIYNEITEGGRIEYKSGHEKLLSYHETWKIAITSNYIIRGSNSSDNRRQAVYCLEEYFNEHRTVRDEYGHSFFSEDWENDDWSYFFNVMFEAVKYWLRCDYKKPELADNDYRLRKLEDTYPVEFRNYIDKIATDPLLGFQNVANMFDKFKVDASNSSFTKNLTSNYFSRLIKAYCKDMNYSFEKNSNRTEIKIKA